MPAITAHPQGFVEGWIGPMFGHFRRKFFVHPVSSTRASDAHQEACLGEGEEGCEAKAHDATKPFAAIGVGGQGPVEPPTFPSGWICSTVACGSNPEN